MSLARLLRQNRRVRKLQKMLRSGVYSINTVEFIRELESLHATRLTRRITVGDVNRRFQTRFMQAVLQAQATRSRAVEIKMRCFRTQAKLQQHINDLTKYLMAKYAEPLHNVARTKGERENIVRSVFGTAETLQQEMSTTMAIADLIVADLDATGWRINNIVDVVKHAVERGKQF